MAVLFISVQCIAAEQVVLRVAVTEKGKDGPLPCRAWVQAGDDRLFEPISPDATPYAKDRSFSCDGSFDIKVPAGQVTVHVERGKEYYPVDRVVDVAEDGSTQVDIKLERWIDMAADGWYSADLHVHFGSDKLDVLKQLALADDVNWVPAFSYWNQFEKDWPHSPENEHVFADPTHFVSRANEEIERIGGGPFESVGALFIFGLPKPVYVEKHTHTFPPDAVLAGIAKKMDRKCLIDTDKPLWAENVVTMAMGHFDSVQVCHNHYHREQTIHDAGLCCGMASSVIEEEPERYAEEELFHRTNGVYYRWLNCGFRLAATGGSAIGVMAVPLGYNRTYAYISGEPTPEKYIEAVRDGRTFATSGPMLRTKADDMLPGATIRFKSRGLAAIKIETVLESIEPIESIEYVLNGVVVRRSMLRGKKFEGVLREQFNMNFRPQRSGWLLCRATYRNPHDGKLRQAHTSPFYFEVDRKPTAFRKDAEYMIRWIDELLKVAAKPDRYENEEQRREAIKLFNEARQVYTNIANDATRIWGD